MKFHPYLPQNLLEDLKSEANPAILRSVSNSDIFADMYERRRACFVLDPVVRNTECVAPMISNSGPDVVNKFTKGIGRSVLHLAARNGDLPLAYECLRMGTNLEKIDVMGMSPLYLACQVIRAMTDELEVAKRARLVHPKVEQVVLQKEGVILVAKLLVKQHANVNLELDGHTPLSLVATASCWTMVELLLQYGARTPPSFSPSQSLSSSIQRSRFLSLTRRIRPSNPLPPRPCPCWSGQTLNDCHAGSDQPYPSHFLCVCGSQKTFGKCCSRRQFQIMESWDANEHRIRWRVISEPTVGLPPGIPDSILNHIRNQGHDKPSHLNQMGVYLVQRIACDREVDAAFAYALQKMHFNPRPWAGQVSKMQARWRMDTWNRHVDEYINMGNDQRSKLEIELAAKVGINGGPLYKHCESLGCDRHEKRDVERMRGCGGCKAIFYCSETCQTFDWKRHKTKCKEASHEPQRLASQVRTDRLMVEFGQLADFAASDECADLVWEHLQELEA